LAICGWARVRGIAFIQRDLIENNNQLRGDSIGMKNKQRLYLNIEQTVDHIIENLGNDIKIGMPLGLGKPVPLINALYQRVKKDPTRNLTIKRASRNCP
jgi:hypothetical protein